ncbi:hypothetical protein CKO09_03670 [Chromatium weissei]|nr:hypothetical protein [Chromatium weissei]
MQIQSSQLSEKRQLLKLFAQLNAADRHALLAFANFLTQRIPVLAKTQDLRIPQQIKRPETETVIGAIKRLSKTYDMLDHSTLLNDTSTLMSAHVLQGRSAEAVIDELETVFSQHYQSYCDAFHQNSN